MCQVPNAGFEGVRACVWKLIGPLVGHGPVSHARFQISVAWSLGGGRMDPSPRVATLPEPLASLLPAVCSVNHVVWRRGLRASVMKREWRWRVCGRIRLWVGQRGADDNGD